MIYGRVFWAGALLAIVAGTQVGAATLVNGSFEDGTFNPPGSDTQSLGVGATDMTGWTVVGDVLAWIGGANPWNLTAADGDKFLDLTDYSTGAPFGGVSQSIATNVGSSYRVDFMLGSSAQYLLPVAIEVSAAGMSQSFSSANPGNIDVWEALSWVFTANSGSTDLTFLGSVGSSYIGLDDIAITEIASDVPVPASLPLLLGGIAAFGGLARTRRRGSQTD